MCKKEETRKERSCERERGERRKEPMRKMRKMKGRERETGGKYVMGSEKKRKKLRDRLGRIMAWKKMVEEEIERHRNEKWGIKNGSEANWEREGGGER